MIAGVAVAAALVLIVIALVHVVWAFGDRSAANAPIPPRPDGTPLFAPSRRATLSVAALLLMAAFVLIEGAGLGPGWIAPARRWAWTLAVALVFLLRGVGDRTSIGLFKKVRGSRFARRDTLLYTPLALALAV